MRRRLTSHPEIYFIITVYESPKFRARSLPFGAIDIFFVYTRLVLCDIIARYDSRARLIIVRLFSPSDRVEKERIKEGKKKQVELRRYEWPRAPTALPGIPVAISFRQLDLFGAHFYRIGQSAPKLDISPCVRKNQRWCMDASSSTFRLRKDL